MAIPGNILEGRSITVTLTAEDVVEMAIEHEPFDVTSFSDTSRRYVAGLAGRPRYRLQLSAAACERIVRQLMSEAPAVVREMVRAGHGRGIALTEVE